MNVLVTGSAGFIGFHLCRRLLREGHRVTGVDNLNDYYSVALKRARHRELEAQTGFTSVVADIADYEALTEVFRSAGPAVVVNLAAQPGVRYSLTHPFAYARCNLDGFLSVLECCRHADPRPRLVYASSSSVYGGNTTLPFAEDQPVDTPVSLYAASKKANELMAHAYSHLYGLQTIGLRFFTVYGPWGRPDMAMWLFTEAMLAGKPIQVFNHGDMFRDFTYIDDIVQGIAGCMTSDAMAHYELFNIGNHRSEKLTDMIEVLANTLGIQPRTELLPMQPGDVKATYADVQRLHDKVGYEPTTPITVGIPRFVRWYKEYHGMA